MVQFFLVFSVSSAFFSTFYFPSPAVFGWSLFFGLAPLLAFASESRMEYWLRVLPPNRFLLPFHHFSSLFQNPYSLRSRRLEVAGERENGRARGRHARGEGAPARKAPENRFNSHSVSADISNWSIGSRGKN